MVVTGEPEELAGYKVPTGRLLASGFRLAEAFALAVSEAGWHLLFMAWHIPAADDCWYSVQAAGSAFGRECSQPGQRSPLTFVRPGVKPKPPSSGHTPCRPRFGFT